jgi:hypothetical protein
LTRRYCTIKHWDQTPRQTQATTRFKINQEYTMLQGLKKVAKSAIIEAMHRIPEKDIDRLFYDF